MKKYEGFRNGLEALVIGDDHLQSQVHDMVAELIGMTPATMMQIMQDEAYVDTPLYTRYYELSSALWAKALSETASRMWYVRV